jgi:hypothetical protein
MPLINWSDLPVFEIAGVDVTEPWIMVVETLRDATHLRIKSEGSWATMGGVLAACGPDGHASLRVHPDQLVVADCPVGALIGKIGGSSASLAGSGPQPAAGSGASSTGGMTTSGADGRPFALGSLCVVTVPATSVGPFFIGFNSVLRPVQVTRLRVTVGTATPTT